MKSISRGQFLKKLWWMLLMPYLALAILSTKKHATVVQKQKVRIPGNLPEGIHFFEEAIVVKENNNVELLSPHCTHLGCHLSHVEENQIRCPCHGSAFDKRGFPVKEPAIQPLRRLHYERDPESGEFLIYT
jgi:Rieske Fe-S protein